MTISNKRPSFVGNSSRSGPITRVKVTHSGLAQDKISRDDYRGGWPGVLEHLKAFVEEQSSVRQ